MNTVASIFESFNARALNPLQVAATFVPSPQFRHLCTRCHTIVLGPRGSGKTTLMKMLQTPALESWNHPDAESYIDSIDFTGVFIATDISWGEQLASLGSGQLDETSRHIFSIASFTTHVLRSLANAMQSRSVPSDHAIRSVRRVNNTPEKETRVVTELARVWHLHGFVPTFSGLRQALSNRLSTIRETANKEMLLGTTERSERLADIQYLHMHFLQAAASGIEIFDDILGCAGERWGLLFDELEIAPDWIHEQLIRSMRSTDERFLFKLALNPFNVRGEEILKVASAPAPGQDFDQLALWYAEKRDAYGFCRNLWNGMLRDRQLPATSANLVLGKSVFESDSSEWKFQGTAYRQGSRWYHRFKSLQRKDESFKRYLKIREINLDSLESITGPERAIELRKIAPLVAARDFFLQGNQDTGEEGNQPRLRSRKSQGLYAGAESLFAISEGNPRWFIGLVKGLLDDGSVRWSVDAIPKISPAKQAAEVSKVAQRFAATLRTMPVPVPAQGEKAWDVVTVVRKVGKYFHAQAITDEFRPEPTGSFVIDSRTSGQLNAVLIQALNAGAIVYVPDDNGQLILTSLRGKRFRLSYLLAPLYNFPIRLGKPVALSSILESGTSHEGNVERLPFEENDEKES